MNHSTDASITDEARRAGRCCVRPGRRPHALEGFKRRSGLVHPPVHPGATSGWFSALLRLCRALLIAGFIVSCTKSGDEPAMVPDTGPASSPAAADDVTSPRTASSADSAVGALREYYTAINAGAYQDAYRLWASGGQASGQSLQQFSEGFAETESSTVIPGSPGRIEGAAGSRFIEIPAVVRGVLRTGEQQCFEGSYTLVRSVVDGATPDQRNWRIYSAALDPCRDSPGAVTQGP